MNPNNTNLTLTTFSGIKISNLTGEIDPLLIDIYDIAHGLANTCRFSGQTKKFYSVAVHSVIVATILEHLGFAPIVQLVGLLHDASEAYISDVPSPAKYLCDDYLAVERRFMNAIAQKFKLQFSDFQLKAIKEADATALSFEKTFVFTAPKAFNRYFGLGHEQLFLDKYFELMETLKYGKAISSGKLTTKKKKACKSRSGLPQGTVW